MRGQSTTDFLPNHTVFFPANQHVGAHLSICVVVLTKHLTVIGCRLYRYQYKVISTSSERYMNHKSAIVVRFLSNLTIFDRAKPYFGANLSIYIYFFSTITVYGCRFCRH